MLNRVYTEATPRLIELHKNYKGRKNAVKNYVDIEFFDNVNSSDETGYFWASHLREFTYNHIGGYTHLSEQEFIEFMELGEFKEVFNPQSHYDNRKGSLYKVATDLELNHWEFDIFKRLVRCRKKNQFEQDLQKIKDTIDIYLKEYEKG